ncbi:hypothetical protein ASPWEDRAFT_55221 [Aspergillus wentii DTO 134E9]|uniref:SMP-30/Gluconolactonase/LRE-like region domain-containing protein n=1 Tax=Aspergillus wentii DTO 134E9 TaxID=1073089 RepID=A0A1L9R6Z5_ASPWE|nr:uncharacterized protein ASPWEDRAFT_55221 [Aspergillus wentii DTO 134E9]OJJ30695.1 hypothetical protein ASPWEDRAFT_55221 [Aspergillus wentii DTO 134E9]
MTITAQQWTSLPSEFRRLGSSEHSQNQKRGRPLESFLEGPLFVPTLSLLFVVDILYGRIFSIDPNTTAWSLIIEYDGEPNGLAWNPITRTIIIADFKQGILSLDPQTKSLTTLVSCHHGERLKGPNDLIVTTDSTIFFTDQGMTGLHDPSGHVYRLDPDDLLDMILANGPSPNDLILNRDRSALFVAMTRDNSVWHIPFYPDGSVQRVDRVSSYFGIGGPDGMTLDEEGNVFVAHSTPGTGTINLTWGGEDSNVLYIVESETGSILMVKWHCSGWLATRQSI